MADRNFGLLVNPGNYSGSSAELTDEEKKQLRAISALQMGASMLANNTGNYGAFAPVLGSGLQNGLASYQFNKDRMQKDAEQRRLAEASRAAYQNAYTPASPAGFNVQGMGSYTNPADAAVSAGLAPATLGSFSDMGIMPNTIAATEGKPFPSSLFNLQDYQLPEQPVTATPATQGGLDFARYGQNLIESGYPKLYDKGIDIALASQPKNVEPKLVTRWNPEKRIEEQGWVQPGSANFTPIGEAKPTAESYKERTISPDGQTFVKQYSIDGGRSWKQIEGTSPYDIRAASGSSSVTVNGFPKEVFKNERDLRNDFQGLPTTKGYREVESAYRQIEFALKNPSAANDLVAATKFMKLLDPGSVVRESELGMAMAATGKFDQMSNYYNMLNTGQKLTPKQRQDFTNSAKGLYAAATKIYNQSADEYRGLAKDYQLDPERIAKPQVSKEPVPAKEPDSFKMLPNATKYNGQTVRDTVTNKRYKAVNGKWMEVK